MNCVSVAFDCLRRCHQFFRWPLVINIIHGWWISRRTTGAVRTRAWVITGALAVGFVLLYIPGLLVPASKVATFTAGATGIVEYFAGKDWFGQLWVTALLAEVVNDWTATRIWESEDFTFVLRLFVIFGAAWIGYSFLIGHPLGK